MPAGKYIQSYDQYLILRNFDPSAGKLVILKRALIDSWGEPGFHRFWQVWNPGVGYLLYRCYRWLGGYHHRLVATMAVFTLCGFLHDLMVMLIFRRPFMAFTAAFILFGGLALINRAVEPFLGQDRWPRWLNGIGNVGCLAVSIYTAVQLQMLVFV
jgi:hypothetical protein